jgi:hypothetical protein
MSGSFNNYARKVRNVQLSMGIRSSALHSCVQQFCGSISECPYIVTLARLRQLVESDLRHSAEEAHLLAALQRIELARNQILELMRAFERKRIRQKYRGRRFPSKAEQLALSEAITAIRKASDLLPLQ